MRVVTGIEATYPWDPARFFDFGRFSDRCADYLLVAGHSDIAALRQRKGTDRVVYLELEEPNRFVVKDNGLNRYEDGDLFDVILSICPYTTEWREAPGNERAIRRAVFFPFNERHVPAETAKTHDVVYTGHVHSAELVDAVRTLSRYRYAFVSGSKHEMVTHHDVGYQEKLQIIAGAKVTLVHNVLFLNRYHARYVRRLPRYRENAAFDDMAEGLFLRKEKVYLAPQLKSRTFEAAFCRSLILCRKDRWNVIERYFQPQKEFIYYEPDRLEETLAEVLGNYDAYRDVVDRAFDRAMRSYTTEAFANRYLIDPFR